MAVVLTCPHCGQRMTVKRSMSGTLVLCPRCKQQLRVGKPLVTPDETSPPHHPALASPTDRAKRFPGLQIVLIMGAILLASLAAVVGRVASKDLLRWLTEDRVRAYERYVDPVNAFSVDLPKGLQVSERRMSLPVADGIDIPFRAYQAAAANYGLAVTVYEMKINEWRRGRTDTQVADDMLAGAFAGMGANIRTCSAITRDGCPVRRAVGMGRKEGRNFHVVAEAHIRPDRIFALQVLGTTESLVTGPVAERFLNSFEAN